METLNLILNNNITCVVRFTLIKRNLRTQVVNENMIDFDLFLENTHTQTHTDYIYIYIYILYVYVRVSIVVMRELGLVATSVLFT